MGRWGPSRKNSPRLPFLEMALATWECLLSLFFNFNFSRHIWFSDLIIASDNNKHETDLNLNLVMNSLLS